MSTIRERPIIFSGPMVRAILDGRKTMTRRVIKPQPELLNSSLRWTWRIPVAKVRKGCCESVCTASRQWWEYLAPEQWAYAAGDRLWVKETWQCGLPAHPSGIGMLPLNRGYKPERSMKVVYRADSDGYIPPLWWRSPLFLPRWASRITLEITDVRADRVQDIDNKGCCAEGFEIGHPAGPRQWFRELWDSINAKRGFGWETNCWVWVIEFKKLTNERAK